jgi:hypothetical protein
VLKHASCQPLGRRRARQEAIIPRTETPLHPLDSEVLLLLDTNVPYTSYEVIAPPEDALPNEERCHPRFLASGHETVNLTKSLDFGRQLRRFSSLHR